VKFPPTVFIVPDGDLTFKLVQTEYVFDHNGRRIERVLDTTVFFVVSRQVMLSSSPHFKTLLAGSFGEANQSRVELRGETFISVELWLRCLHGHISDSMYTIPIKEVYNAVQFSFKCQLKTEMLGPWFAKFWSQLYQKKSAFDLHIYKQLLFPCQIFDHIHGFAAVSKFLAYNDVGHTEEHNPTYYLDLYCEKGVISKSSAACLSWMAVQS